MQTLALLIAMTLACVHLFGSSLLRLSHMPRSRWLSFASGLSVAYVFVHLLPEVAEGQRQLEESDWGEIIDIRAALWLVALLGLSVFYGLERMAKCSRRGSEGGHGQTGRGVFWIHIGSFGLYNVVIGYLLLHRLDEGGGNLMMFGLAMALHFAVNDAALNHHHRQQYRHAGRWILAGAVLGGYLIGLFLELQEAAVGALIAFIGGGVVLNVLKEELPDEHESRFLPFAAGAASYSLLLLAM
ncbi:MAG: hypothetical protein M3Q40_02985 [Pseudomonadota bacterium]|nr:hypothetical protein [Pseudomonadota bacterium]